MSFIAKNPLILPEVENSPTAPKSGTRGVFASKDGWYDISSNGRKSKFATTQELEDVANALEALDGFASKEEINDSYKYYGVLAIIPSNVDLFTFTINDDSMTASIGAKSTDMPENVVIPYKYVVGEKIYSVTSLAENAFKNCTTIKRITIPNTVTNIGRWAFQCCSSLNGIDIPTSIVSIGMAATSSCNNLAHLYYKGTEAQWNDINKSELNNALYIATKHYEYTLATKGYVDAEIAKVGTGIGNGVKYYDNPSVVPSEQNLFVFSKNSDGQTAKLTGVASNITGDIIIPYECNISGTTYSVSTLYQGAFMNQSQITSVTIPNTVTAIQTGAFQGCSALTSVILPDSLTNLGGYAFSDCVNLKSIIIPEGVPTLNSKTFYACNNLTSVTIPVSVTKIDHNAVQASNNLKDIYYAGTKAQWDVINIGDNAIIDRATKHYGVAPAKVSDMQELINEIDSLKETISLLQTKSSTKTIWIELLSSDWEEDGLKCYQVISDDNNLFTQYSKVDLQPTVEQLIIFHEKDISFVTENDGGIMMIYCIGQKPEGNYTIQATVTEVETNG